MDKLVAVYGSLRKGMGNHGIISGNEFYKQDTLTGNFRMVSLGGFPGVVRTEEVATIVVELYKVQTQAALSRLDMLEGYRGPDQSNFYTREEVVTDTGEVCDIYLLDEESYGSYERVDSGDWVAFKGVKHG